ncbi:Lipid A 3-O-deacylase (PagL) [Pedobacter caeni]|uniref:Lipid A 3-O-deacylase (PagL) n=2 Tax=Pedobacter caeni TaxID=288992 RepID=A0A1M5E295_9SPHI|nr:Lipid A 3-O-deacylase (PagL) [Pedobacter caeni]
MGGVRYYFAVLVFSALMLANDVYGRQKSGQGNSFEFSPQVSLALFTAENKLRGNVFGGEFTYHINKNVNPRPWMRMLNLNSIDLVFNYKNMGDVMLVSDPRSGLFGNTYALLAALNFTLLKNRYGELWAAPGLGIGYLGQTYFTNQNQLIGSHLNFASRMALKVATKISPSMKLSAGVDMLHFSNGAIRTPNHGINVSSVSLGLLKSLHSSGQAKPDSLEWKGGEEYAKHKFDFGVNIGRRGIFRSKEGLYKTGLYAGYNYRLNELLGLSSGLDAVYYHSIYEYNDQTYESLATSLDRWRVGLAVGPDIWMDRLAIMTKYGYYLHYNHFSPSGNNVKTYWTAGLKYYVLNWAAVQSKVYIHKTEADYLGFGIMLTP